MSSSVLQIGAPIAYAVRESSGNGAGLRINTIGDVLSILRDDPPSYFPVMKTACGLFGVYLDQPVDAVQLDTVEATRDGFRRFLAGRKYAENSIRSYIFQIRMLMKAGRRFGWDPKTAATDEWKALLGPAAQRQVVHMVKHFSRLKRTPAEVTVADVEHWERARLQEGIPFSSVRRAKYRFWRLLRTSGVTNVHPPGLRTHGKYGLALVELPDGLLTDIQKVLRWKTAKYAPGRPKRGKVRAISAKGLEVALCQLAGFAIENCGVQTNSLIDLLQKGLVEAFVDWCINERGIQGASVHHKLVMIIAVVKYHPAFSSHDFSWLKPLCDGIPMEGESERKTRKAQKYVSYDKLETVPAKIREVRMSHQSDRKGSIKKCSRLAAEELLFRWLLILPWRQRNVRECRIAGPSPNLFKSAIPPFSELDKPRWVIEEEETNPHAEFWQIRLSPEETKTDIAIHILLPRQLIRPLEEYLLHHRPNLVSGQNAETLFITEKGHPLSVARIGHLIGNWTAKFTGVRTTPHLFRDAVAFKWLKEHPDDYLTLSKMLWHRRVETTIRIYGSRYNESSGVNAMEAWLDARHGEEKRK